MLRWKGISITQVLSTEKEIFDWLVVCIVGKVGWKYIFLGHGEQLVIEIRIYLMLKSFADSLDMTLDVGVCFH